MPERKPQGKMREGSEGNGWLCSLVLPSFFTSASTYFLHSFYIQSLLMGCVKQSTGSWEIPRFHFPIMTAPPAGALSLVTFISLFTSFHIRASRSTSPSNLDSSHGTWMKPFTEVLWSIGLVTHWIELTVLSQITHPKAATHWLDGSACLRPEQVEWAMSLLGFSVNDFALSGELLCTTGNN